MGFSINMGSGGAGLTLAIQQYNDAAESVDEPITENIVELGSGLYRYTGTLTITTGSVVVYDQNNTSRKAICDIEPPPTAQVTITPVSVLATQPTGNTVDKEWDQHTAGTESWTLLDGEGNPVDLSGEQVQMIVFTEPSNPDAILLVLTGSVSGDGNNVVNVAYTTDDTEEAISFAQYEVRTLSGRPVLARGDFTITPGPAYQS